MSETILNPNQVDGKSNLTGGNSFTGTQEITISDPINNPNLRLNESGNNNSTTLTTKNGTFDIVSTNKKFKFNEYPVVREIINLGTLTSGTTNIGAMASYVATVSGSISFSITPIPTNTSNVESTINLLLNITTTVNIDWGVNANSVLSSFTAGKYEIRLRYNNSTSNWVGEVLKAEATPSHTKCYVSFNENDADQTNNITLTPNFTPTYTDNTGYTAFEGVKSLQTATGSLDKGFAISDPNNVLTFDGTFTIALWVRIGSSTRNTAVFSGGTSNLRLEGTGTLTLASQTISGSTYLTNSMHYVEINRDSENKVRYFIDGTLQNLSNLKTISGTVKFSDSTLCFSSSMDTSHCFQDFVITDQAGHTANYDVPTAPYVFADNSIADYHDPDLSALAQTVSTNTYNITQLQTLVNNLSFVEFVSSLPQTGTTGKIYAVPLNETDLQGRTIIELFLWNSTNSDWDAVGAFSTNIDASTLVLKSMFEFDSGTGTLNINLAGA